MPNKQSNQRRNHYQNVLTVAANYPQGFSKYQLQTKCSTPSPQLITRLLNLLVADGILQAVHEDEDVEYKWLTPADRFATTQWIERQIAGSQVSQAPQEDRPREKLLSHGVENLSVSELLAILIRSGRPGESAVQAGMRLAKHFDDKLERICDCSPSELKAVSRAISPVAYCQILAGIELGRRISHFREARQERPRINSTQAAIAYCRSHFHRLAMDRMQEEFHIVTLDTKLQPIQNHRITVGTLDASLVHPREVFRAAIRDAAASILLVHNHPSGDPTPSRQDHEVTSRLKKAGELIGISVIDHIIVAGQQILSLAECG